MNKICRISLYLVIGVIMVVSPKPTSTSTSVMAAGTCSLSAGQVLINEIFPSPSGGSTEWVELYNTTDAALDLSNCHLDDITAGGKPPVQIPNGTSISAHGFWTMDQTDYFNNSGDDVNLLSEDAVSVLDHYTYGSTSADNAWYRNPDGGSWAVAATSTPTKGTSNGGSNCGTGTWVSGNLEIHHINVGQGDSTLVISPTGKSLLFDAAESLVGPYIETVLGCKTLDYVVISHFHNDHIGSVQGNGLWNLVEVQGFTVGKTLLRDYNNYLGEVPGPLADWKNYIVNNGQLALHPETAVEGTGQVSLGGGVTFNILTVDGNGAITVGDFSSQSDSPSENDYSVGALISFGKFDEWIAGDLDGLFTGRYHDIETSVAREIGDVDIYRVHHHGSEHSSNATFINQIDPEVSIISVGDNNGYDHPKPSVITRLHATSDIYMTERGELADISNVNIADNIIVKTTDGSTYTVNATAYAASEPVRIDTDADGYFLEADPDDNNANIKPAPTGGCDPDYQICICALLPGQVVINEFFPRPATGEKEWVELFNTTNSALDLSNCYLDDIAGGGGTPKQIPAPSLISAKGFWVMDNISGYFNDSGDDVRLLSHDKLTILDSHTYGATAVGHSWYRTPDGGNWSPTSTDTPTKGASNVPAAPPSTPAPLSPPTNSTLIGYTPTLKWKASTPQSGTLLDHYRIQMATDSTFLSIVADENVTLTEYISPSELSPGIKYYWRVQAYNTLSQASPWSVVWSFKTSPTIFDNGIWWIKNSSLASPQEAMTVSVNGVDWGKTKILQFGHLKSGGSYPETAVIYNTGYLRLTPLGMPYGTSFILGPAHWDDSGNYFHNLQISHIDIDTSSAKPSGPLEITISAHDYRSTLAPIYHFDITHVITFPDPTSETAAMEVTQTFTAATDFSLSAARQTSHEGFKWVQLSSMYIDDTQHDSDGANYTTSTDNEVSIEFSQLGCDKLIFNSPLALDEHNPWAQLHHKDDLGWQGNTPNTIIRLSKQNLTTQTISQGYIACSSDPNDDNVGFWVNDDSAPLAFIAGQTNSVTYSLISQDNPMLASPGLLLPFDGDHLLTNRPVFDWKNIAAAENYELQVSTNPIFSMPVLNVTTNYSMYTPVTDLPRNTVLYWRVRSIGSGDATSDWSETRILTSANPPSTPILLLPVFNALISDYSPIFTWKSVVAPNGTTFKNFIIQVDNNSDFSSPEIDNDSPMTPTFTPISDLSPNTKFYWRVRAVNTNNELSNWSTIRYFRTALLPVTLNALPNTDQPFTLRPAFTWTDPNISAPLTTNYTIQIAANNTFKTLVNIGTTPTGTIGYTSATNLPAGKLLYWRVRANGANGPSLWSTFRSFTTPTPPSTPTLLLPANNSLNTNYIPLLKWSAVTVPAPTTFAFYQIQVDDDPLFGSPLMNDVNLTLRTQVQLTTTPLPHNTKFYWRVLAFNNLGQYSTSAVRFFRTRVDAPTLLSPADTSFPGTRAPTFDWSDATGPGAITGYTIQVSASPTMANPVLNKTVPGSTYLTLANLPAGKTLYWRVRVNGANGPSAWSTIFSFTTP